MRATRGNEFQETTSELTPFRWNLHSLIHISSANSDENPNCLFIFILPKLRQRGLDVDVDVECLPQLLFDGPSRYISDIVWISDSR